MTWFADSSSALGFDGLRAVGWLERGRPFATGVVSQDVYRRLKELLENPWQPFALAGLHSCDLCRHEPEARGGNNLFVPGDGFLFVCPELMAHYINAHGYRPPEEFCEAVLRCPETHSMEYKKAFLANGGRSLMMKTSAGTDQGTLHEPWRST